MLRESRLPLPAAGWGRHRPGRLRAPRRHATGPTTAPPARPRPQAPRPAGDPVHPHPARPGPVLRAHLKRYGTSPDGRLFRTARGGLLQDSAYSAVWAAARAAALTPAQHASPLARRPYDLRHAAVSLWLNAGVPATEVARRAGHSVAVLLKVYAHCIDGQADAANKRIADALGGTGDSQDDQEP